MFYFEKTTGRSTSRDIFERWGLSPIVCKKWNVDFPEPVVASVIRSVHAHAGVAARLIEVVPGGRENHMYLHCLARYPEVLSARLKSEMVEGGPVESEPRSEESSCSGGSVGSSILSCSVGASSPPPAMDSSVEEALVVSDGWLRASPSVLSSD